MTTKQTGGTTVGVAEIQQLFNNLRVLVQASTRWESGIKPIFGKIEGMLTSFFAEPSVESATHIREQLGLLRTECAQSENWEAIKPEFTKLEGVLENYFTAHTG